jgi:uncharacterized membrane protein
MDIIVPIALSIFYILIPILILYLCAKYSVLDKIGAAIMCYIVGMTIGNIGLLPAEIKPLQEMFTNLTVPLAIPLMLFSMDVRTWGKLAGKTLLSFGLMIIAVLSASSIAFFIFKDMVPQPNIISGMYIGCYTGGTINLTAIGLALGVKPDVMAMANTADIVASSVWIIFILSVAQRLLNTFLPRFKKPEITGGNGTDDSGAAEKDYNDYTGIFNKQVIPKLLLALGLSVSIFAVSYAILLVSPESIKMAVFILTITTLAILSSLVKKVRNIKKTYQAGQYTILIFCLVIGSMSDFSVIVNNALAMLGYAFVAVFGSWIFHVLLAYFFKIDSDTTIITATAGIFSPPFVPMVAAALKNRDIVVPGIAVGIIGWVVGSYLGVSWGYLLQSYFM